MEDGERIIVPEFGDLTADVIRELQTGSRFEEVQVRRSQNRIAREERDLGQRKFLKFGRLRMRVDQEAFDYWGLRLGYECWDDPQFLAEFERDNPEVRVSSRSHNTTVRMPRTMKDASIGWKRKAVEPLEGGEVWVEEGRKPKAGLVDQFGRPA